VAKSPRGSRAQQSQSTHRWWAYGVSQSLSFPFPRSPYMCVYLPSDLLPLSHGCSLVLHSPNSLPTNPHTGVRLHKQAKKMVDSLSHTLPFPPFSVDWVDAHNLVITGGGGASKTGVPNGVLLYMVRGGVERLVQRRFYQTGDELPYFAKALPALDLLAIAVGNRVQLLRLHNLKPLGKPVLELEANPNVMDPTMVIALFAGAAGTASMTGGGPTGAGGVVSGGAGGGGGGGHYMAVGAHDGHIRVLELSSGQALQQQQQQLESSSSSSSSADGPVVASVGVTPTATDKPFRDLAFHPSGRLVLGSCEDGTWRAVWVGQGQQQQQQQQQPPQEQQQQQMELIPAFTLFATSNGGMVGGLETTAVVVGKDQQPGQGLFYTSRCGKFSEDGRYLYTVHYVRRGPKNADKRPVLTKWAIDLSSSSSEGGREGGQVQVRVLKTVRLGGVDPVMCIDLRGAVGVAGDCSGRTIIFQTRNLSWKSREKMHNFGVTSLSFYPPLPPSFGPSLSKVEEEDVRIASTSGDKTLRLQYLHPSRGRNSSSGKRGWFSSIFFFFLRLLLLLLLLGGVFVALSVLYEVPPERILDHFFDGVYEEPAWVGIREVAREGWKEGLLKLGVPEQVKRRMEEGVREGWREGMALVEVVGRWVKEEMLPVVIPVVVKAKERVDGWRGEL